MIELRFPGKLFILGEFFIMEAGQTAVVSAVDRYLSIRAEKSDCFTLSSDYGDLNLQTIHTPSEAMALAAEAVKLAYQYLDFLEIEKRTLNIEIESDLLYEGKKIGLGSSGVVIVAILAVVLKAHDYHYTKEELFKLAVLCQKKTGVMSSGGDLAAAIYGSCIAYRRYDPKILDENLDFSLVQKDWPLLEIEYLPFVQDLNFAVYWSKKENNTDESLRYFEDFKKRDMKKYQIYRKEADRISREFIRSANLESLTQYRNLMLLLADAMGKEIEIPDHRAFIEEAEALGAYAKVSGSGGGDCAIALSKDKDIDHLKNIDIGVDKDAFTKKR